MVMNILRGLDRGVVKGVTQADSVTRQRLRTPRAAGVAGIVFSFLLTVAFVLIRFAVPGDASELGAWVADDSKRTSVLIALNLLPFAGIAFLWFIGVVRDRIGQGEDRLFATVFLGSGLLFVAMLFCTGAVAGALVATAQESQTAEVWSFGRRVVHSLLIVYAMRMAAVFTISTTTIATRLGLIPRWLTALGLLSGFALLLSVSLLRWVELVFPAWVFVFSVHILIASFRAHGPSSGGLAVDSA